MWKMLVPAAMLAMCGCAQVGQFTATDADQAAALAMAVGDTTVVDCYKGLAMVGSAASTATQPGIFTKIEEKRAAKAALQNPACAPLYANVLGDLLKATPLAPLVP